MDREEKRWMLNSWKALAELCIQGVWSVGAFLAGGNFSLSS